MKNQKKQMIILLIVLVALVAGLLGLQQYNKTQSELPAEEAPVINLTDLSSEEIVKFSYNYEGETLSFEKEGETWHYTADKALTLNQALITNILSGVATINADQAIENVTDMTQYGLKEPSNILQFETAAESVILQVGDYNEMSDIYYVSKPSETTVYTVSAVAIPNFDYALEDLITETVSGN